MANAKIVRLLDDRLIEEQVLDGSYRVDYEKVHRLLNTHVRKIGTALSDDLFDRTEKILREWLDTLSRQGASQEKLTSYLRCGLAHLSFDYIDSGYRQISAEDLVTRALISFKQRNYHKSYYKPAQSPSAAGARGKKKSGASASPEKKGAKKAARVKAIKRKPASKKKGSNRKNSATRKTKTITSKKEAGGRAKKKTTRSRLGALLDRLR